MFFDTLTMGLRRWIVQGSYSCYRQQTEFDGKRATRNTLVRPLEERG